MLTCPRSPPNRNLSCDLLSWWGIPSHSCSHGSRSASSVSWAKRQVVVKTPVKQKAANLASMFLGAGPHHPEREKIELCFVPLDYLLRSFLRLWWLYTIYIFFMGSYRALPCNMMQHIFHKSNGLASKGRYKGRMLLAGCSMTQPIPFTWQYSSLS